MDPNIIARLNAYAEDAAVMTLRIADLEADNRTLLELLHAALDQLHMMTRDRDRMRERLYQLLSRLRTERHHQEAA